MAIVDALKQMDAVLEISQDVKVLLDAIKEAVFIDDGSGETLWINTACENLYKIDRNEILGRSIYELEEKGVFSPSVARQVLEQRSEVTIMHSNRNGKQLLTTGTPIHDKFGNIVRVVSTSSDITELVNTQGSLENMRNELDELKDQFNNYGGLVFRSKRMYLVIQLAKRLSEIDSTVLITGESGVGKGIIAKYIHMSGHRMEKPFVKINCGAIPEALLESELFGHEEGAFTGSKKAGKIGLFELGDCGTVFLDEIGELPMHLQVKILQVIQDKEIMRVGGLKTVPIDVRIIAATNKDLEKMVSEKTFREDLYYRLNVVPINIPPLRERKEDIAPLTKLFLKAYNEKFSDKKKIHQHAIDVLTSYTWPGNVRELENIIERLVITADHQWIKPEDLPSYILKKEPDTKLSYEMSLVEAVDQVEKQMIQLAIKKYKTTRKAAEALKVSQPTIVRKMMKYQLTANA